MYKRQLVTRGRARLGRRAGGLDVVAAGAQRACQQQQAGDDGKRRPGRLAMATFGTCLLYTSDAADERSSVDLGGRRIIKKK